MMEMVSLESFLHFFYPMRLASVMCLAHIGTDIWYVRIVYIKWNGNRWWLKLPIMMMWNRFLCSCGCLLQICKVFELTHSDAHGFFLSFFYSAERRTFPHFFVGGTWKCAPSNEAGIKLRCILTHTWCSVVCENARKMSILIWKYGGAQSMHGKHYSGSVCSRRAIVIAFLFSIAAFASTRK